MGSRARSLEQHGPWGPISFVGPGIRNSQAGWAPCFLSAVDRPNVICETSSQMNRRRQPKRRDPSAFPSLPWRPDSAPHPHPWSQAGGDWPGDTSENSPRSRPPEYCDGGLDRPEEGALRRQALIAPLASCLSPAMPVTGRWWSLCRHAGCRAHSVCFAAPGSVQGRPSVILLGLMVVPRGQVDAHPAPSILWHRPCAIFREKRLVTA